MVLFITLSYIGTLFYKLFAHTRDVNKSTRLESELPKVGEISYKSMDIEMFWFMGDKDGYFGFEGRNGTQNWRRYIDIKATNWKCDYGDCGEGRDIGIRPCDIRDFDRSEYTRTLFKDWSAWGPMVCLDKTEDVILENSWNYKNYQSVNLVIS